jgi:hypothetical protein
MNRCGTDAGTTPMRERDVVAQSAAIDRLVALSPELERRWSAEWGQDGAAGERLPFVEVGTISTYLVGLVNDERWDEMAVFAAEIERMCADSRLTNLLQVGLIEDIQNTAASYRKKHGGSVTAGRVKARLGLLAQAEWEDLDRSSGRSTDDL